MQTPSQHLFTAILRATLARLRPGYQSGGVSIEWDLGNEELRGTFTIPIKANIDGSSGEYVVTTQEFLEEPPNTTSV